MRRELQPGLFSLCEMLGEHSLDALAASTLDSSGKAVMKSVWKATVCREGVDTTSIYIMLKSSGSCTVAHRVISFHSSLSYDTVSSLRSFLSTLDLTCIGPRTANRVFWLHISFVWLKQGISSIRLCQYSVSTSVSRHQRHQ